MQTVPRLQSYAPGSSVEDTNTGLQYLLIRGCTLLAPDEPGKLLHEQDILIAGQRIAAVGPTGSLTFNPQQVERVIRGKNRLVVPGLVNAHTHSLENLMKATSLSMPLELWLVPLFGDTLEWSPNLVYLSTLLGALEMLKTGTTAVLDHLWTSAGVSTEYLDATMHAYHDAGIRAAVAPSIEDQDLVLEAGNKYGMTFPSHPFTDRFKDWAPINQQVKALERFISTWNNTANGRLRCLVGPSGIHWCSPELLETCLELSECYHTGMHLHAVETELQAAVIRDTLGQGGIRYLKHMGLLRPGTSLAHTIWLEPGDLRILADTGTTVVHNPISNLRLGSGRFPLSEALDQGVIMALGSDGSASNDRQNMFDVLKQTGLMHNLPDVDYHQWPQPAEILHAATEGGAAALGLSAELGRIEEQQLADLLLIDLESDAFLPLRDPYLHLIYCEHGTAIDGVIVNGEVVVEHGKPLNIDEQALRQEIREQYQFALKSTANIATSMASTDKVLAQLNKLRHLILQKNQGL
ncbi:5-methylthioadenosine/S-adenosylhomocysteine deaminase [Dictyobacter alpinus]|uniref:5-methylthioadenosine/S-adenosylhomocysteine deaminase n=1 Tax=Dictyobacter alpinus TaxID=2014873 RepID=A0A402BIB6_9CHLR|nr:amidohydrolase family protein [Dictyobacter alpinus]GCE31148.1 5-methylthioadenosine/S-adenosylhomocysteine deaminase [Dictyobacter alpinus]